MKRQWWIILCFLLLLTTVYFGFKYKSAQENQQLKRIPIKGIESIKYIPVKDSELTLIIYFSHRSGEENMKESFYWNKLFDEIPSKELFIIGMIPGNEEIGNLREKWNLKFPIGYDEYLILARTLLISFTPFRIVINREGKVFYMSPNSESFESHKDFYFQMIELLKKAKEAEYQKDWVD